jgi:hypothetical protein
VPLGREVVKGVEIFQENGARYFRDFVELSWKKRDGPEK